MISLLGKVPAARTMRLDIPPLYFGRRHNQSGDAFHPFGDRFGVISRLDYYNTDDLKIILQRAAAIMGVPLTNEGAEEIARRSRGTPLYRQSTFTPCPRFCRGQG